MCRTQGIWMLRKALSLGEMSKGELYSAPTGCYCSPGWMFMQQRSRKFSELVPAYRGPVLLETGKMMVTSTMSHSQQEAGQFTCFSYRLRMGKTTGLCQACI